MLIATALVMMMTPALGLFYAGLVRAKNTLNTFMMCIAALAWSRSYWAVVGYSLAFDGSGGSSAASATRSCTASASRRAKGRRSRTWSSSRSRRVLHHHRRADLRRRRGADALRPVPRVHRALVGRSSTRCSRTGSGAAAGWHTTACSTSRAACRWRWRSGFSALAAALVVGARKDYGRQALLPHNAVYVLLGAGLLWFGWFGFNGGSGLNDRPGQRPRVHQHAARAGRDARRLVRCSTCVRGGKVTAIGAATAIIVGCVVITPAGGYISPMWAIALGALAALPSYAVIVWRPRTRVDETLDVLAAHGIAGFTGILVHRASSRRRRGTGSPTACSTATRSSSAGSRSPRSRRRSTRSSARSCCCKLIGALHAAARHRARGGHRPRRPRSTARRPTRAPRARSWSRPRTACSGSSPRWQSPTPEARHAWRHGRRPDD